MHSHCILVELLRVVAFSSLPHTATITSRLIAVIIILVQKRAHSAATGRLAGGLHQVLHLGEHVDRAGERLGQSAEYVIEVHSRRPCLV